MRPIRKMVTGVCVLLAAQCPCSSPGVAQQQKSLTDRAYARHILQKVDSLIDNAYVLAGEAPAFAREFRARCNAGVYDSLVHPKAFGERVTADLQTITRDRHVVLRAIEPSDVGETTESNLHHPVRYYRLRMSEHTGFTKLEWIDGKIGYLELRRFNHLSEAREMLGAAMTFLADANAVIIDLRENGGGSGDYLSNYFLPHPTQLTGAYYRQGNELQESWTSRHLEGERMLDVPLFVLTSRKTFSAAESFAYDMHVRKRATLVGDTTKGGAHDVGYFKIDDQFELYLSVGRGINPVTQSNWEGIGVVPDVCVPAAQARDTAIVLARRAAEQYGKRRDDHLKRAVERMEVHLAHAERLYQERNPVAGKASLDSLFTLGGQFGLITEFFINVLAYNYAADGREDILFDILKKSVELFPRSATAYETLASASYDAGKHQSAIEQYQKVLELDPDNANARRRLRTLEEQ